MKKYWIMKIALIVFVIQLVISCVPSKPPMEEEEISVERVIKKLESNRRKVKTFQGTGILRINTEKIEAKASFEVMFKKPDSIKLSVYGPFGLDLAEALITKNDFKFFDIIRNQVYTGKKEAEIIKRVLKVDISFDDLMDAFAGAVNLTDKLRLEPTKYIVEDDLHILTYIESDKKSIYKIKNDDLAITNYQLLGKSDKLIFEGAYNDFKYFNDVAIPYVTVIENKEKNESVNIEYRKVSVNKTITNLKIDIPKDAEIIKW